MNLQGIGDGFSLRPSITGFPHESLIQQPPLLNNCNPKPSLNNNNNNNSNNPPVSKKKRNLPGTPDPDAEVIALSPKTLMATNRFICEICNKGFQRDQNLQLHRRGHNLPWKLRQRTNKEVKKKVYICPEKTCVHHDSLEHSAISPESKNILAENTVRKNGSARNVLKNMQCNQIGKLILRLVVLGSINVTVVHFSLGFPEMVQMAAQTNLFGSSSIPNFMMNNQFSSLDKYATTPSTTASLTLSSFPPAKKEEGREKYNKAGMAEGMSSIYSHDQNNSSSSSSNPSTPMAATALLQKAAQMGSTRSNPYFLGTSLGVTTSSPSTNNITCNEPQQVYHIPIDPTHHQENLSGAPISNTGASDVGSGGGSGSSIGLLGSSNMGAINGTSVSNLSHQLMMHSSSNSVHNTSNQPSKLPFVSNGKTRDFLGMGAGDGSGRPFSPQDLANFVSISSAMGLNHSGHK